MNLLKYFYLSILMFSATLLSSQQLIINEIMSSNDEFLLDEDGEGSDWIEIYNTTNASINLLDYHLSDQSDNLSKWAFPEIEIGSNEFLIVFASGKDRAMVGNELHTNFSIKATGEELFLSYNGTIIHSTPERELETNFSSGLLTDGNLPFVVFNNPTPGSSNNAVDFFSEIVFSKSGGIYKNAFDLSISSTIPDAQIYYTTDGSLPTLNSFQYTIPIELTNDLCSQKNINQLQISPPDLYLPPDTNDVLKIIVIRAIGFNPSGSPITDVVTNSYIINELGIDHSNLPIVSISTNHGNLFDYETGIFVPGANFDEDNPNWSGNYYERGNDWEKEVHVEFYEGSENEGFKQKAGLRTHGGNSRRHPQKGMRLYARSEYGASEFEYPVFDDKAIASYKRIVLKPFSASWTKAGIEDFITNKIAIQTEIDAVATKTVVLYLNGEYWGIYFLQERVDERYIANNYSINKDSVDLIQNWWGTAAAGNNENFLPIYNFVEQNDLSISANYEVVREQVDIDNFIDYQIFEIFIANRDWPINNMKCWREQKEGAKWRWIFFDGDAALKSLGLDAYTQALSTNNEGWPTDARSTLFLRKLLSNPTFNKKFFNRMEFLLNNDLSYSSTEVIFKEIVSDIRNEIFNQIYRFKITEDYSEWSKNVTSCNGFLSLRPCELKERTEKMFGKDLFVNCDKKPVVVTNMSIIPNPNNGNFTLDLVSSVSKYVTIQIYNVFGQRLTSLRRILIEGQNSININQDNLPEGVIFVSVVSENDFFSAKMICVK